MDRDIVKERNEFDDIIDVYDYYQNPAAASSPGEVKKAKKW